MSDTKPLPDDPDRTAATPPVPDPAAADRAAADQAGAHGTGAGETAEEEAARREPVWAADPDPDPSEPVWAAEPGPAHPAATAYRTGQPGPAGPGPLRTAGSRLTHPRTRVPLLVGAVALVLGCCLGAGVVAVGAVVFGDGHRGDERGRISRDDRAPRGGPADRRDERGGDGKRIRPGGQDHRRRLPSPAAPPAATTPAQPTPTAS